MVVLKPHPLRQEMFFKVFSDSKETRILLTFSYLGCPLQRPTGLHIVRVTEEIAIVVLGEEEDVAKFFQYSHAVGGKVIWTGLRHVSGFLAGDYSSRKKEKQIPPFSICKKRYSTPTRWEYEQTKI